MGTLWAEVLARSCTRIYFADLPSSFRGLTILASGCTYIVLQLGMHESESERVLAEQLVRAARGRRGNFLTAPVPDQIAEEQLVRWAAAPRLVQGCRYGCNAHRECIALPG